MEVTYASRHGSVTMSLQRHVPSPSPDSPLEPTSSSPPVLSYPLVLTEDLVIPLFTTVLARALSPRRHALNVLNCFGTVTSHGPLIAKHGVLAQQSVLQWQGVPFIHVPLANFDPSQPVHLRCGAVIA